MLETVLENIPHLKVEENRTLVDWVGIADNEVKKMSHQQENNSIKRKQRNKPSVYNIR